MFVNLKQLKDRHAKLVGNTIYNKGELYSLASLKTRGLIDRKEVNELIIIGQYLYILGSAIFDSCNVEISDLDLLDAKPVKYIGEEYSIDKFVEETFKQYCQYEPNLELSEVMYILSNIVARCPIINKRSLSRSVRYQQVISQLLGNFNNLPRIYRRHWMPEGDVTIVGQRYIFLSGETDNGYGIAVIDCLGLLSNYLNFSELGKYGKIYPHFVTITKDRKPQFKEDIPITTINSDLSAIEVDSTYINKPRRSNDGTLIVTPARLKKVLGWLNIPHLYHEKINLENIA